MNLACPGCGLKFPVEAGVEDADARGALVVSLELGLPACLVVRYLALFRPRERALSHTRLRRLLEDLLDIQKAGSVRRKGREWAVPLEALSRGLETVVERGAGLDLPLRDHAYLKEVLARSADKAEADAERKLEEDRQREARARSSTDGPAHISGSTPASREVAARHISQMKDIVGRRPG